MIGIVRSLLQYIGITSPPPNYRWVDDAIKKGDIDAIESMMKMRDRSLIRDIHNVARNLGQMDLCVGDLLLTPGYRVGIVYDDIIKGASKGDRLALRDRILEIKKGTITDDSTILEDTISSLEGMFYRIVMDDCDETIRPYDFNDMARKYIENGHKDIMSQMILLGANDWNAIACGAAKGGYIDVVIDMINRGANDLESIGIYAIVGGHMNIVLELVNRGLDNYDMMACYATLHGHRDIVLAMIEKGSTNMENIAYAAARSGYIDILMDMISMNYKKAYNYHSLATIAAKYGHKEIVLEMVMMGANNYDEIRYTAYRYGYTDISSMDMNDK